MEKGFPKHLRVFADDVSMMLRYHSRPKKRERERERRNGYLEWEKVMKSL